MQHISYNPVKFIRNIINNLIVSCPYSIHKDSDSLDYNGNNDSLSSEGDAPQINCGWKGKLSLLDDHINYQCLDKPYIDCPFGCDNKIKKKQITRIHFEENQSQHINTLLSMIKTLRKQVSQCQKQINDLERKMNENNVSYQREIVSLKQQILSPSIPSIPPPPPTFPPLPKHKNKFVSKSKSKSKSKSRYNKQKTHSMPKQIEDKRYIEITKMIGTGKQNQMRI